MNGRAAELDDRRRAVGVHVEEVQRVGGGDIRAGLETLRFDPRDGEPRGLRRAREGAGGLADPGGRVEPADEIDAARKGRVEGDGAPRAGRRIDPEIPPERVPVVAPTERLRE